MSAHFQTIWTFDDYLSANRLNAKLQSRKQWLIAGAAILTGVLVADPFGSDLVNSESYLVFGVSIFIGLAACAVGFWLTKKVIMPQKAAKMFEQLKLNGVSTSFEFDEAGIRIASSHGTSTLEWSHVTKWAEDQIILMFYRTDLIFFAVPKAQISPDAVAELRQALIAGNVPKAG